MNNVNELKSSYLGKKVFVTGHTGFKGSWLVFMLNKLGAEVYAISNETPKDRNHSYYALGIEDLIVNSGDSFYDIRDFDIVYNKLSFYKPDYVFHLAAQAIVSTSYKEPLITMQTNIMGTTNVLEAIRLYQDKLTSVIITSDKCYKNKERFEPYLEHEEMGGEDPYSASKGACELVFHAYMESFFKLDPLKNIASTRAGNVFGGGDWSENRLVPDCIRDILKGSGVVDIRSPNAVRPWTFVVEILYGYLALGARLDKDKRYQGSWNFASGETRTVLEVCESIIDELETGQVNVDESFSIGKECGLLLIDETKARKLLGWDLVYSVDEALKLSADWYHSQFKGENMVDYSTKFIENYFEKTVR